MSSTNFITETQYKQISILVDKLAVNIAKVGDEFILFDTFDPSVKSSSSSVDFVTLGGCIFLTEFLDTPKIVDGMRVEPFLQSFERYTKDKIVLRIRFNMYTDYFIFGQ